MIRAAFLLLALAAVTPGVMADSASDPGTGVLSEDAEARWIPFDLTPGNQIRFAMTLDGHAIGAILDTGVSVSVLARGSAAVDPARVRPGGSATAIGGAVAIGWMPVRTIALGGLTRTGGGVSVAAMPALATGGTGGIDLLVGRDLIGDAAIDIDYAARRFRLIASGRLPFQGAVAPLTLSAERRVYESAIRLGARRLAPMVVDTGDGSAITVTRAGWDEAALATLPTTSAIAYGLAGPAVSTLAIVPELRIGQLIARQAEVRVEPADGFSQAIGVAGRIGSGFLQNYRVLLDPGAGRMVLRAGPQADRPPLRSTSGLLVAVMPGRLQVLHVMRGGPGEAGGWTQGDTICSVDGTPIAADYARSPIAAWPVGTPGTRVALGLCDGPVRTMDVAAVLLGRA